MINKLIIIGNGFDLAHNLPTSYPAFATFYKTNSYLVKFRELCNRGEKNERLFIDAIPEEKWYSFEENIEKIVNHAISEELYDKHTPNYIEINQVFSNISELMKKYLENVMRENKPYKPLHSIRKEFSQGSPYVISFNYTDTFKLYTTENYEYIHGSILEDERIILGFSNDHHPDVVCGSPIRYCKEVQKLQLLYSRFLKERGVQKEKREYYLKEFEPHLMSLFSGKGEWNFPLSTKKGNQSNASKYLIDFYSWFTTKFNNPLLYYDFNRFKNIDELVIMGHGLESDILFFNDLTSAMNKNITIKLYTYKGEKKEDVARKKQQIYDFGFDLDNIKLVDYE